MPAAGHRDDGAGPPGLVQELLVGVRPHRKDSGFSQGSRSMTTMSAIGLTMF